MSDKKVVSPPGSAAFRSSYAIVDATSAPKIASNCVSTSSADSDANRVLMSALAVAISAVGSDRNPDMTEQSLGWCRRAGAVSLRALSARFYSRDEYLKGTIGRQETNVN